MPRWPERDGYEVRRLEGFVVDSDAAPSDGAPRSFHLRFAARPAAPGEEIVLALDGIATAFEVSLNGTQVLTAQSMFIGHELDVTALVGADNELVIRCLALEPLLDELPRRPRQRWRTKVVPDGRLRFVRTTMLGRAPGFAPGPPTVGPWRPVWLVRRHGVIVQDLALRPSLADDAGVLELRGRLRGIHDAELPSAIRVELSGPSGVHAAALDVQPDGALRGTLTVAQVARWWPHTHGDPALHDVRLMLDDATVLDARRIGFRAVAPGPDHDVARDGLALSINGVAVFARGAVWTPVSPEELEPTLRAARDAGLNLVRLAGTGVYEDAAFHDLCDELGILVWQDFMFANLDYPIEDPHFRAQVEEEARQALAQVCGRPSLAVLCGNSEVEQQVAMFGADPALGRGPLFGELLPALAREAGADVPYVPSAPCGGELPFHPGGGVDNYFGVGGYRRPLSDVRRAEVRFASECLAFANVPDAAVEDGEGVAGDVGADWDFADVRDHYLAQRYGVDPQALRTMDRDRYLALSRAVTGDVMADVFGEWRRAASPCAGAVVLWLRDRQAGSGWGLLDHRGAPKPLVGPLRRALAPVAVWLVDEGLRGIDVHVANDGAAPLEGELHVALLADGRRAIEEATVALSVTAHGVARRGVEAVLGRFADVAFAYRFGPPAHDTVVATLTRDGELLGQAFAFPTGPPLDRLPASELGLSARATRGEDGTVAVTVAVERLAYGVRVHAQGCTPSDDVFCVAPGIPRTILLRPREGAQWAGATVTGLNLAGESSVAVADG